MKKKDLPMADEKIETIKKIESLKETPIQDMPIEFKLGYIQSRMKVLKDKEGYGYKFRSNEDILEQAKPFLLEVGAIILQSDEMVLVGERYYTRSSTSLVSCGENITTYANAREPESLAKMSMPQVSGSCSSYSRKYSACGLLAIDNNKDPDSMRQPEETKEVKKTPKTANEKELEFTNRVEAQMIRFAESSKTYKTPEIFRKTIESVKSNGSKIAKDPRFIKHMDDLYKTFVIEYNTKPAKLDEEN